MVSENTEEDLEITIKRRVEQRETLYQELETVVLGKAQGHSPKQVDSLKKWLHESIIGPMKGLTSNQLGFQIKFYAAALNAD